MSEGTPTTAIARRGRLAVQARCVVVHSLLVVGVDEHQPVEDVEPMQDAGRPPTDRAVAVAQGHVGGQGAYDRLIQPLPGDKGQQQRPPADPEDALEQEEAHENEGSRYAEQTANEGPADQHMRDEQASVAIATTETRTTTHW